MTPKNVLVVDDELVICNGCRMILEDLGYQVTTCMTCSDGIDAVTKNTYDLILLDLKLPDQEGTELLKTVHKINKNRIIVMSGYATVQSVVKSMKLGAVDFLPKPFTDDELLTAIQKMEGLNQ